LQILEKETGVCLEKITLLRSSLARIRESNIKKGLHVIRLNQTRSDLYMLYGAVKLISHAQKSQPIIKTLIAQSDFVGALDLLEEASAFLRIQNEETVNVGGTAEEIAPGITVLRNQSIIPKNLDFTGVVAVARLSAQLSEISMNIAGLMEGEFTSTLVKDLTIHLDMIANTPYSNQKIPFNTLTGIASSSIRNILGESYSLSAVPAASITGDESRIAMPPLSSQDEALKATLAPLIFGLIRTDKISHALGAYKDAFFKQLKSFSKQYYPKLSEPGPSLSKQEIKKFEQEELAKQLRSMSFDAFYSTLVKILIFFIRFLQRAAIVNGIIVSIIKDAEGMGMAIGISKITAIQVSTDNTTTKALADDEDALDSFAPQVDAAANEGKPSTNSRTSLDNKSTYVHLLGEMEDILFSATELSHTRSAKLVAVRQDQNSQLNPKDFYRLFNCLWEFLSAGEKMCGRLCFGLKGSILAQAKSYINYFHEEKSKQISLLLDNEQWIQADIPIDFQHMTEELQAVSPHVAASVTFTTRNPSKLKAHPLDMDDDDELDMSVMARHGSSSAESLEITEDQVSSKYLVVDGTRYYTVVTVLMFLKSLTDYVQCAKNVPSLTPEILNRIYEFLKLFNSRTCQLILGSGALRSAGLQSVTAKHIALTSQSLGLIMAVVPYIRNGIAQFLNPRQMVLLGDFDRIIGVFECD
jgi:vacuolar protein sorting-associated protein 54